MKKLLWLGLLVSFLMPVLATAQTPFDGTWKIDVSKAQLPQKPEVYLLQGGMFNCKTCVPPIEIKADGQDQKVTGHPYYDTLSVKILDDSSIEQTRKKDGKIVVTSKQTVSPDGGTLTFTFTDSTATNGDAVSGKGESTRVAKGPAGSHSISGSWRASKMDNVSENGLLVTYKVEGDTLTMTTPTGQAYTAKLDGTEAPYKGDPGTSSVSVKKIDKNTIEETDKRDGKVISVTRITVGPDGKGMTIAVSDKLQGTTSKFVAEKQ
jgi:hypothetical protein